MKAQSGGHFSKINVANQALWLDPESFTFFKQDEEAPKIIIRHRIIVIYAHVQQSALKMFSPSIIRLNQRNYTNS